MKSINNNLKTNLEDMTRTRNEMRRIITNFFTTGGYQNQINLISCAIYDIVEKGAGETNESMDNEFAYTNRYIRESVYELTELQRFLISLHEAYLRHRRCCEQLQQSQTIAQNAPVFDNKRAD